MSSTLIIAVLAGLGGMLGWGFSEFATKKAVDKVGAISSLVWAHLFGSLLLVVLLLVRTLTNHTSIAIHLGVSELISVLFFGALQALVYYFAYTAFEKGKVSILSPIFASFSGLVALGSVLLFGEVVHASLGFALLILFAGVLLINLDIQTLHFKHIRIRGVEGLREILIATVLATVWTLGWDAFTANKDWLVYTTLMFVGMSIAAIVIAYFTKTRLLHQQKGAWGFLWLIALGEVVAYLAITIGYSSTNHASVVAILSGASSLPTILLARLFIKEKISTLQTIAAFIIIIGVIVVAIS